MTDQRVPQLLTVEQVAEQLSLNKQTVWALARNGQIPVVRISPRRLRFDPDDVQRWIDRRTTTRPR
jgi:excisionase family DNA binding protein